MPRLIDEIMYDASFIKSHRLQPQWWKVAKVFILLGFFVGYCLLFGLRATVLFFAVFLSLMFGVHVVYRVKTKRFTQSWLDFVVVQEGDARSAKSIGKFYYLAIAVSAILSLIVSQAFG